MNVLSHQMPIRRSPLRPQVSRRAGFLAAFGLCAATLTLAACGSSGGSAPTTTMVGSRSSSTSHTVTFRATGPTSAMTILYGAYATSSTSNNPFNTLSAVYLPWTKTITVAGGRIQTGLQVLLPTSGAHEDVTCVISVDGTVVAKRTTPGSCSAGNQSPS